MPLTISDMEDARMRGREKYRKFRRDWENNFYGPLRDSLIASFWQAGLDPATKSMLQQMTPDAATQMDGQFGRKD